MKRLRNENLDLDAVDLKILRLLEKDARASTAELARAVGLSAPSVSERVKQLQESGVIEAYCVRINPAALGLNLSAWLRIRPVPGQLAVVAEIIRDLPEIAQCDRVTGEDCFIALAHVGSVVELERVIDRIIPYAMTNTAIIQSSPVAARSPLAAIRRQG
ncbi:MULTISPECIES: Lrp/AsnC family transcriptional regulator [unclassified Mesorhizobium]|uniref:Lrp/AsnC family transcriptional regulator n=1 Tax=unclassified Mesorhizobium TaxID=325217 RepID=UPI00112EF146|nr:MULTISPECIES: Lrp/AsnC family transcriptional regulator [unclassified Mesorhizobium]TPJ62388.1 Lrp/AsnC family transcriptional regulator [Mesorhizobium sp. B2-6-1]TPL24052.1 Lrp/AsnC family transcriptional regulator [Mesorhizobium sp. B2-4-10]TPN08596.1 Lrp/AsnC family transcriptional regulator [Mesorhizobium sp. B2-1-3]